MADKVGKDLSTISKKIRKHRIDDEGYSTHSNDCMYRYYCQKQSMDTRVKRQKNVAPVRRMTAELFVQITIQICVEISLVPRMYAMGVSASMTVANLTFSTVQM